MHEKRLSSTVLVRDVQALLDWLTRWFELLKTKKPGEWAHIHETDQSRYRVLTDTCLSLLLFTVCLVRCDGVCVVLCNGLFWYWFEPGAEAGMIDHLLCISYQPLTRKQRKEWSKGKHREMKHKLRKENNSPWLFSLTMVDRRDINSGIVCV